ncbi:YcaO-like family protein [Glycomyces harbinensis]|uniref:Ribosomal protein S12 methylthiotransferase accessory factor n=1 Tax=Glycomyces harbinensis TaxID=58114 RepID=A0A1G6TQB8_9ACTN|nr:YcaO-like family protein [Glycomyces harbinensis]SDD31372.1 ribosomal protein S12 methylthiotransferase accessory factor [Glycomyces harbinensis]
MTEVLQRRAAADQVGGGPAPDGASSKACWAGTHRALTPEQTLRRIEPLFPALGITRLADVTWLDEIGIPVYQAVRPDSWSLSVSQGKGLTDDLAKISAAMESIETWHAEHAAPGETVATVADMERTCGYRVRDLSLEPRHYLRPGLNLRWTRAKRLDGGEDAFLPSSLLSLDGRVRPTWTPPLFVADTNGLASGNTFDEAALHGLYEVIERDALTRAETAAPSFLDLDTVDGSAAGVRDQLRAADVDVRVEALPSPTGLACFRATIWSEMFPVLFVGAGAHLDRDVALCRALTEAAQSRVTEIAATRDDLTAGAYRRALAGRSPKPAPPQATGMVGYDAVPSVSNASLAEDLRAVVAGVLAVTGRSPLAADHTVDEVGIPVVRVVCPGLLFDSTIL